MQNYIRIFPTLKYRIHSFMIFISSSENIDKLIFSKQCSSKKKKARLKYYELLIYSHSWKKREFPRFWQRSQKRKVAEKSVQEKRKESEKGRKLNETRKKKRNEKKNCDKVKKKIKKGEKSTFCSGAQLGCIWQTQIDPLKFSLSLLELSLFCLLNDRPLLGPDKKH